MSTLKYIVFNSLIGEIAIIWDKQTGKIKQIILPDLETRRYNYSKSNYSGLSCEQKPSDDMKRVIFIINSKIMGKDVDFNYDYLDFSGLTEFQKAVLEKQVQIPHSRVTTYKKLACLIGKQNSARPVANALAANPFPILIPCHRTLRSDWSIGGYAGVNDGRVKKFILENEGVQFTGDTAKKQYHHP